MLNSTELPVTVMYSTVPLTVIVVVSSYRRPWNEHRKAARAS